ncbi:hypothetical protein TNCV_2255981 [Trichonephila clavipes]|nr:hypothetical protein TNCV_2255981 [Trichonephila clavipes]
MFRSGGQSDVKPPASSVLIYRSTEEMKCGVNHAQPGFREDECEENDQNIETSIDETANNSRSFSIREDPCFILLSETKSDESLIDERKKKLPRDWVRNS